MEGGAKGDCTLWPTSRELDFSRWTVLAPAAEELGFAVIGAIWDSGVVVVVGRGLWVRTLEILWVSLLRLRNEESISLQ